jgi:HK97 family phage major capsid protein
VRPWAGRITRLGTTRVPVDQTVGASTDATEIYTGQWDQLLIGMRTSFTVQSLNELYADTGERGILCHVRVDVQPANGAAFAVHTGLVPPAAA